ncbi:MAG TPA: efflux RND transporter permease subunit [Verrucomicrobia bacterium]|nr:efflux RND transporter permease subunit [Verrucomicrobiota bacterium]
MKEEAGQLYSEIAVAISSSILMSMLVAIAVIPCAASRWFDYQSGKQRRKSSEYGLDFLARGAMGFQNIVIGFISWLLASVSRMLGMLAVVLSVTFCIIIWMTPEAEYLPEGEEAKVFTVMSPPPGYNIHEMEKIAHRMNEFFVPFVDDDPTKWDRGETEAPALYSMLIFARPTSLWTVIATKDPNHIDDLIEVIKDKFGEIPGMNSFSSRGSIFSGNSGGTRSIDLDIYGEDLAPIYEVGLKAFRRANELFDDAQVRSQPGLKLGQPLLEIRPDWERAREFGIDAGELGFLVSAFSDGAYLDEFFLSDDKIDMFLYSTEGKINSPQDLDNLLIYSRNQEVLPLSALATVKRTVHTDMIRRVDARRTVTLTIVPPKTIPLESAVEIVKTDLIQAMREEGEFPAGVNIQIAGAVDRLKTTRQALSGNFVLAILIAFLLMVAIFSHWGYPFIIMLSVPLGISGGVVGLWLLNHTHVLFGWLGVSQVNQPLDMITMLGFLILIGTVVNNPILIVDQTVRNIRDKGMEISKAVLETIRTRMRPIMMSTITTICGLSPLVYLPGAGSELYRGLGTIVLFGLLFSTITTLFFIPCLLSLLLQLGNKLRKLGRG